MEGPPLHDRIKDAAVYALQVAFGSVCVGWVMVCGTFAAVTWAGEGPGLRAAWAARLLVGVGGLAAAAPAIGALVVPAKKTRRITPGTDGHSQGFEILPPR